MKSLFGKLSILCFVSFWIVLWVLMRLTAHYNGFGAAALLVLAYLLFTVLGIVFACVGAVKKEG